MEDKILSVGIDIGTSTTQIIFSQITMQNTADSFLVPNIKIEDKITYISNKIRKLIYNLKLNLCVGEKPEFSDLKALTDEFAKVIFKTFNNQDLSREEEKLFIQHKSKNIKSQFLMFSGGVSEFVYSSLKIDTLSEALRFKDIGPVLGYSIRQIFKMQKGKLLQPKEKIRATVIGAGSHSVKISGSTIMFEDDILPVKSVPIVKIPMGEDEKSESIYKNICSKSRIYKDTNWAIAFKGPKSPKYSQIKK
ncbi:ethanolamine ammonia-lyase reactivating factor EutA [Clostridium sp. JNZ X4-2]